MLKKVLKVIKLAASVAIGVGAFFALGKLGSKDSSGSNNSETGPKLSSDSNSIVETPKKEVGLSLSKKQKIQKGIIRVTEITKDFGILVSNVVTVITSIAGLIDFTKSAYARCTSPIDATNTAGMLPCGAGYFIPPVTGSCFSQVY